MPAIRFTGRIPCLFLILFLCFPCSCRQRNLESYIENEDWEGLLAAAEGAERLRAMDISYINIALASGGRLAADAFSYLQVGAECLFPEWQMLPAEGRILAYILYAAGHISLAQRMAFETDVLCSPAHDGNMIKMLVKTNLIYGNWKVAEKYICLLESEGGRNAGWAGTQRKFLENPEAVAGDSEYGPRLKCIPEDNFVSLIRGYDADIKDIIKANPTYGNAVEILGVYYLLRLDFESFKSFLDEYGGTESLPSLPRSFAEAACMLSEQYPGYWKTVGVSKEMYRKYSDFKSRLANRLSMDRYKDTYWVYVMRRNAE